MTSSTRQEQHHNLELQQEKKGAGRVECLGFTFEDELPRREHFMALLREKLQDPEFRMTLGFPLGFAEQAGSGLSTIVRTWRQVKRLPPEVESDPGQKLFQLTLHWRELLKQEDSFWKKLIGASVTPDQARLLAWLEQTGEVESSLARLATGVSASETRKLLAGLVVNGLVEAVGEEGERLRLAPHLGELLAKARAPASSGDLSGEGTEQVTAQVTAQVTEQVTVQVSEQVVQVVLASQGEQSRAALMEAVGLSHREHFRESYLVPALAAGYLEMTIPDKPISSRQRYRLTPAGHAFLQTLSQPTP